MLFVVSVVAPPLEPAHWCSLFLDLAPSAFLSFDLILCELSVLCPPRPPGLPFV